MPDISATDLLRALASDEPMQDWIADCVGLAPAPLHIAPDDPWSEQLDSTLPWLSLCAGNGPQSCMIHLVVGIPDRLTRGMGQAALRRAAFLKEARCPVQHDDFRLALLTPQDMASSGADCLTGFPNIILAEDLGQRLRNVMAA